MINNILLGFIPTPTNVSKGISSFHSISIPPWLTSLLSNGNLILYGFLFIICIIFAVKIYSKLKSRNIDYSFIR